MRNRSDHSRRSSHSATLYSKRNFSLHMPKLVDSVPDFMRPGFSQMMTNALSDHTISDDDKIKYFENLAKLATISKDWLKHFADNPDELTKQVEESRKFNADMQEAEKNGTVNVAIDTNEAPSFVLHMLKYLGLGVLSNAMPLSTLALPLATGMPTVLFGGAPPGGISMCQGLPNCIEGYLADANHTQTVLSQISRAVDVSGSGNSLDLAFRDCLSLDKISSYIKSLYDVTETAGTKFCQQSSGLYQGNTANVIANGIPGSTCDGFQQNIIITMNSCKAYSINLGWIIFGAVAGAVAVGALITLLVCCCANSSCRKPSCC